QNDKLKIPKLAEAFPNTFEPASTFTPTVGSTSITTQVPAAPRTASNEPRIPPPVTERPPPSGKTTHETTAAKDTHGDESTNEFRWYEVRAGDTLTSIARRELGSNKRLKDLQ